jgi:glycosyltransferase involved in cell wall biosynthesis
MASITALLFTQNDALRLGRALETLYACDDILVVDHGSRDATVRLAREYGARVVDARPGPSPADYVRSIQTASESRRWILCLDPHESLTEKLAASLFEWKSELVRGEAPAAPAFSVFLREETAQGWVEVTAAQTRLVPLAWNSWKGTLPAHEPSAITLDGEVLRFVFP